MLGEVITRRSMGSFRWNEQYGNYSYDYTVRALVALVMTTPGPPSRHYKNHR